MRPILYVIPVSAALLVALVAFKANRRYDSAPEGESSSATIAPLFHLYDEHSRILKLEAYRGRHKLLIVFFDGSRGADQSDLLRRLRERYDDLHATGAVVLAISEARPSQNRYGAQLEHLQLDASQPGATGGEARYPFRILTDIAVDAAQSAPGPDYPVHRLYGAFDSKQQKPLEAAYIIDRSGLIRYWHLAPDDLGTIDQWIQELNEAK